MLGRVEPRTFSGADFIANEVIDFHGNLLLLILRPIKNSGPDPARPVIP
jgi:hypothetical protein